MTDLVKRLPCELCERVMPLATPAEHEAWPSDPTLLYWGPDPYAEDVAGDGTPVWECKACRYQSAMDV